MKRTESEPHLIQEKLVQFLPQVFYDYRDIMARYMESSTQTLACPVCETAYNNYKDFFACWTGHLEGKLKSGEIAPVTHASAVKLYYQDPQAIEKGMKGIGYEVGVFRGRIDLILRDNKRRLCLVDITSKDTHKRKKEQLRRYRKNLKWLANNVFQCKLGDDIRLFVIHLGKGIEEIT